MFWVKIEWILFWNFWTNGIKFQKVNKSEKMLLFILFYMFSAANWWKMHEMMKCGMFLKLKFWTNGINFNFLNSTYGKWCCNFWPTLLIAMSSMVYVLCLFSAQRWCRLNAYHDHYMLMYMFSLLHGYFQEATPWWAALRTYPLSKVTTMESGKENWTWPLC